VKRLAPFFARLGVCQSSPFRPELPTAYAAASVLREKTHLRDLAVGLAVCDQLEDLSPLGGQTRDLRGCGTGAMSNTTLRTPEDHSYWSR
jgi:hypothetical protein